MSLVLQQQSVIRYSWLRQKANAQSLARLEQAYQEDQLRIRAVAKSAGRFRRGEKSFEDEERSGRPAQNNFHEVVLFFLEEQSHSSSREISKAVCSPKTTIL
jgi:hypothetical protein